MSNSKKLKAICYARTSKVLGQDPTLQVRAVQDFARARGFELIGEYVDQVTGDRERRPGLDRLIADAKAGKFQVVLVTAIDRIFRSTKHMLNLIDELEHVGVSVISIRESLDFTTPAGRMALTVLAAVATLEKSIISERIKTSLAVKKLTAERTGSSWRAGRPSVATNEVVTQVLDLRKRGLSVRGIESALAKRVSRGSIARILKAHAGPINEGVPLTSENRASQALEMRGWGEDENAVRKPVGFGSVNSGDHDV